MKIRTNKGFESEARYAFAPTMQGNCMVSIPDKRPLSEICADFEGVEEIQKTDEIEGDAVYFGYTNLIYAERSQTDGNVTLILAKGGV